jgi:homoserine dehydrogenase
MMRQAPRTSLGVALLGLGTVGRAVVELLVQNRAIVAQRTGCELRPVAALVRDPGGQQQTAAPEMRMTASIGDIVADQRVDLVVEAMGGLEPARSYVLHALSAGKSVVTANKQLLATAGAELFAAARRCGVDILFEATVCSGLPVLRVVRDGCAGDQILRLEGVLNGTTNHVLSHMEQGVPLDQAVLAAQAAGYAEADASNDLEGLDARWKLAILASLAFGRRVSPEHISVRGLRGITPQDLCLGKTMALRLKLLAVAARRQDGTIEARVEPCFLVRSHPLASLEGAENGVVLDTAAAGRIVMCGPGAGGPTAAAAVVADLITAAQNRILGVTSSACRCTGAATVSRLPVSPVRYWIRATKPCIERLIASGIALEDTLAAGDEIAVMTCRTTADQLAAACGDTPAQAIAVAGEA